MPNEEEMKQPKPEEKPEDNSEFENKVLNWLDRLSKDVAYLKAKEDKEEENDEEEVQIEF